MIRTLKVMLHPTNEQDILLRKTAGIARKVYNYGLDKQIKSLYESGKLQNFSDLGRDCTKWKKEPENWYFKEVSSKNVQFALKDLERAFRNCFVHKNKKFPKFKSKKSDMSFHQRGDGIVFKSDFVKLEKIGWIKLAEKNRIPLDSKYYEPRVKFDGLNWYVSVGIDVESQDLSIPITDSIGIDLGIKNLAVCSNGLVFNHDKKKLKKIERRLKIVQRKISKRRKEKRDLNARKSIKLSIVFKKIHKRLHDIRLNTIDQLITHIIKLNPISIVLEDLKSSEIGRNLFMNKAIREAMFHTIKRRFQTRSEQYNIPLILADRYFKSSKICSCCGSIKIDLKLSDRLYKCEKCNSIIDRDLNAAINLQKLAETKIKDSANMYEEYDSEFKLVERWYKRVA